MAAPSDVLDAFLDDLIAWANGTFHLQISHQSHPPTGYVSVLEFTSSFRLDEVIKPMAELGSLIAHHLNKRGHRLPAYDAWGLKMNLDPGLESLKPGEFVLEYRANNAFAKKVYYSAAPLPTEDHLALLEKIEALVDRP